MDHSQYCLDEFTHILGNEDLFKIIRSNFNIFTPHNERGLWFVNYDVENMYPVLQNIKKKMFKVNTLRCKDLKPLIDIFNVPVTFHKKSQMDLSPNNEMAASLIGPLQDYNPHYQCLLTLVYYDKNTNHEFSRHLVIPFPERCNNKEYEHLKEKQANNLSDDGSIIPLSNPHGDLLESIDDPVMKQAMHNFFSSVDISDYDPNNISEEEYKHMKEFADVKNKPCTTCKVKVRNMKKCANCRMITYCSVECQRTDWSEHKEFCSMFAHYGARCITALETRNK